MNTEHTVDFIQAHMMIDYGDIAGFFGLESPDGKWRPYAVTPDGEVYRLVFDLDRQITCDSYSHLVAVMANYGFFMSILDSSNIH